MKRYKEKDPNAIPNYLLQALRDCSFSTRKGYIDKGSPSRLSKLAMSGYVTPKDGGYIVSEAGRTYLRTHTKDLLKL